MYQNLTRFTASNLPGARFSLAVLQLYLSDVAVQVQVVGLEQLPDIGWLGLFDQVFKLFKVNEAIVVGIACFNDCLWNIN